MSRLRRLKGQGLVEFALILPALLLIVLSIIEGALLFQSYLAIQHAAREAARYAVTYQPPQGYSVEQGQALLSGDFTGKPAYEGESEGQWLARRAMLIKQRALDQAMGIRTIHPALDETSFTNLRLMPGFFGVRIRGTLQPDLAPVTDHPGMPGMPIEVEVVYRWEALDPLIGAIVPNGVELTGKALMINEGIQVGFSAVAPPTYAPPPTVVGGGPVPPDAPTASPTPTWTPPPPTPKTPPTPTPTPTGAYIIMTDEGVREHNPWLLENVQNGFIELHQHSDATYEIYWTDNCGQGRHSLDLDVSATISETARVKLPSPVDLLPDDAYLCGTLQEGGTYEIWIESCDPAASTDPNYCSVAGNHTARQRISILVPVTQPDLTITNIEIPTTVYANSETILNVEITNIGQKVVSDTFDIDIYADPQYTPILPGQPGFITSGTGAAKRWSVDSLEPGASIIVPYNVVFPEGGEHSLWAQVDTSLMIAEELEDNNISGPVEFMVDCSNLCDSFDDTTLDPKWGTLSVIGSGPGDSGRATVTTEGELRLEGLGSPMINPDDGRIFLLNQGSYNGNFEMTVKVTDYAHDRDGSMVGLMVRESLDVGARYAAIGVVNVGGAPHFMPVVRDATDATPGNPCGGTSSISPFGEGVWVRIRREGDLFTMSMSSDGDTWNSPSCMQVTLSDFATTAVPGILNAPMPDIVERDTGFHNPSANQPDSGGDGDGFDRNPDDAYADDGSTAQSLYNGTGDDADRHRYYNYGFSIPSGSSIMGIEVRLDWRLWFVDGTNWMGVELSDDGGATWTPMQTDTWERTTLQTETLGGNRDTWDGAWSANTFNSGDFLVRLSTYSHYNDQRFYLDWAGVRVTYGEPTIGTDPDGGNFDAFQLCSLEQSNPYVPVKPPLLRECGSVLSNADFTGGVFVPWVDGQEAAAVVADQTYSCDLDGRFNYGFSMLLRCDRMRLGTYAPFHPWAYQDLVVPAFVSTTESVDVEMTVSLFYAVPPPFVPTNPITGLETYQGTLGRAEDLLQARLTLPDTTALTDPTVIGNGAPPSEDRGRFVAWSGDVAANFIGGESLADYAEQTVRLWIEAPNPADEGDSEFFVDQVRCDICTTVQEPDRQPGTVRRLGGDLRVMIGGIASPMPGVDVWAMQLPDGVTPPDQLGYYTTYSIHDSTYNFYNLNPGTYRIYAQMFDTSGVLYTASETVDIPGSWIGQERLDVDITLQ